MASPKVYSEGAAIGVIQALYLSSYQENSLQFALQDNPNSTLEYKISFSAKEAVGELSLITGRDEDWERLKALQERLQEEFIPAQAITNLAHKVLQKGFISREGPFPQASTPPLKRANSEKKIDSKPMLQRTDSKTALREGLNGEKIELNHKQIIGPCTVREKKPLFTSYCTFDELIVPLDIKLAETKVSKKAISRAGSISAENSELKEVITKGNKEAKGDITLIDTSAEKIEAAGRVILKNETVQRSETIFSAKEAYLKKVEGAKVGASGKITAENCKLGEVTVDNASFISMTHTDVKRLHLTLNVEGICEIVLEKGSIGELIIEDLPGTIELAKKREPFISSNPSSFNFPSKKIDSFPLDGAQGRVEGKLYRYRSGTWIEGIEIKVQGDGQIGKTTFKNCVGTLCLYIKR